MKKIVLTVSAVALLGATLPKAAAGDGWSTAGKIMAGVGAGLVLSKIFEPERCYTPPPVYVNPAPVVVSSVPAAPVVPQPVVWQVSPPATVVVQPVPVQIQTFQTVSVVPVQAAQPVGQTYQTIVVQQPVYVQPAQVIYQPAPVVYAQPVYYAPRPVLGLHLSFGRRACW